MFETYPDVMTPIQAKEALAIGRNKIYNLINSKEIPSFRIGNDIRILKTSLIDYIIKKCYNRANNNTVAVIKEGDYQL